MDVMVHFEMNKLRRLGPVPQSDECSWLYEEVFSEREKRELSERKLVFKIFRIRATFMSARAKAPEMDAGLKPEQLIINQSSPRARKILNHWIVCFNYYMAWNNVVNVSIQWVHLNSLLVLQYLLLLPLLMVRSRGGRRRVLVPEWNEPYRTAAAVLDEKESTPEAPL
ncbi:uncharacterized protein [Narcine bancroftii]|uniref:uncharacterized protein isoform X2 n=1 Tax=Narcine bancroftii TaxID=1343680 RepID=UPI0038322583